MDSHNFISIFSCVSFFSSFFIVFKLYKDILKSWSLTNNFFFCYNCLDSSLLWDSVNYEENISLWNWSIIINKNWLSRDYIWSYFTSSKLMLYSCYLVNFCNIEISLSSEGSKDAKCYLIYNWLSSFCNASSLESSFFYCI